MGVSEPFQPFSEQPPVEAPAPVEAPQEPPAPEAPAPEAPAPVEEQPAPQPVEAPEPAPAPEPPADPEQPVSEPQDAPQALPDAPAAIVIPPAQPVRVDNVTRRSGDDALEGLFCEIVSGPYAGRWGVFDHVVERDITGYPRTIMVISRDELNERLTVSYDDTRPSLRLGGR